MNEVCLNGIICQEPIYQETQLRVITNLLVAVERKSGNCDYIPCVLYGNNAENARNLEIGDCVEITGRLQSRFYKKELENGQTEKKFCLEVSVSDFQLVNEKDGV